MKEGAGGCIPRLRRPRLCLYGRITMSLLSREEIAEACGLLSENYPEARCALDFGTPFQLLIAVVLSAQTTDVSVNKVTPALFAEAPDAAAMAEFPASRIEEIIHSIGMYRTKAANIVKLSRQLVAEHGGEVPGDFDELVKLPGVGRKTANVVLAEAFGRPAIAVDTHVFRLANRIGFTEAKDVLSTEQGLMEAVPQDQWIEMHHALIWHGRRVCSARSPKCEGCCLASLCKKNGLESK